MIVPLCFPRASFVSVSQCKLSSSCRTVVFSGARQSTPSRSQALLQKLSARTALLKIWWKYVYVTDFEQKGQKSRSQERIEFSKSIKHLYSRPTRRTLVQCAVALAAPRPPPRNYVRTGESVYNCLSKVPVGVGISRPDQDQYVNYDVHYITVLPALYCACRKYVVRQE